MEIPLSHAGTVGLFTPLATRLIQRFLVRLMETFIRCCGAIGHMLPLLWIPLYEGEGSRGTIGFFMCHVLNHPYQPPWVCVSNLWLQFFGSFV